MNKYFFRTVLFLGIVFALGYFAINHFSKEVQLISAGDRQFEVEVVDTPQKMALGLGERDGLCQTCAMLFVFPEKEMHSFWMKGMRFPLDIIWFNSLDGRIVHVERNIPADSRAIFKPQGIADRVLEINAGLSDKYGIKVGDKLELEL